MDPSQFDALKAAITKEFAIIQGPPGTGKTYVGLRIAQLLLHNISKWHSAESPSPILVVCYTNHALDQFLEGLLLFTQNIVRVGGRGTNEAISKFQLSNLKKLIEEKREVPIHIFRSVKQKRYELHSLKEEIDEVKQLIDKTYTSVLSERALTDFIGDEHYESLSRIIAQIYAFKDDGFIIHDWLGIRSRVDEFEGYIPQKEIDVEVSPDLIVNDNVVPTDDSEFVKDGNDGEEDIEYIEAQRDINSEDFADVSFDVPVYEGNFDMSSELQEGWKVQGGNKKRKRYITKCLNYSSAMTKDEAKAIKDVWMLDHIQRWRLYKYWLQCYIESKQNEIFGLQQQLKKEYLELCEMRSEVDLYVCRQAHVVGMTTTGAAKYRDIVQHLNPKIVIVEEAAEILESHIVTSLSPGTEHVILIGDHQQLKPSPTVHLLAVKYDLNVSLFERMVKNGMECYRLGIQHRMRPEIASLLVPHIYTDLKNHESVTKFENIKGVSKNVFFITHSHSELQEYDSKSKVNQHEASFIVKLCRYILLQGYEPSQITVLTTYSGQLFALKRIIGGGLLQGVRFTVVDNYQGEESDIVLISFVRSNEEGEIGFLKISNRVCVALSRAKKGLFCIGNFELLAEKSDLWKGIVSALNRNQAIGPSLQLMCQNHPGVSNVVASEKDFDSVPEGGCTRNCDFRLSCGHVCSLMCHPYDAAHQDIRCLKACRKNCPKGHLCKKLCYQECDPCPELVNKKIEFCGHTIKIQCHSQEFDVICTKICERRLPCGHLCSNKCSVKCVIKCCEKVKIKSPLCGHEVTVECFNSDNNEFLLEACKSYCLKELECGHTCKGTCSSCHQGRLHVACNKPCKRVLVCGHECKSPCSKSCPPCKRPCENKCIHSKCPKRCGEPCDICTEPCMWSCPHRACTFLCGEICNRVPCNKPCPIILNCTHPCIGLCSEPCPEYCKICDKEIVEEIFFGAEDEIGAKFVRLEDCGHFFEVDGITEWMKLNNGDEREIQMKACPKCKTVIRKNLRFGNIIKSCLKDIEKVKKITYGDKEHNIKLQKALLRKVSKSCNIHEICTPLINVLKSTKSRSIQEITTMENIINIAIMLMDSNACISTVQAEISFCNHNISSIVKHSFNKLYPYIIATKQWILDFIQDEFLTASEQQLEDLQWEVHRIKLAVRLYKLVYDRKSATYNSKEMSTFDNLVNCIVTYSLFRQKDVEKFATDIKLLLSLFGEAVIEISYLEKQSILKAMGLVRGHWYQCPNGHVYCITECGGAMQESTCNECGERIGGTSHRLLGSNRVATAMDGARHSAWSDTMNMENYRF